MADHDLITRYLVDLRRSVRTLDGADDVVDEAADHLLSTVESLTATGMPRADAERVALERYGPARRVGAAYVQQSYRHGAVATEYTRRTGIWVLVLAILVLILGLDVVPDSVSEPAYVVGIVAFVRVIRGICRRHGSFGPWGALAFLLGFAAVVVGIVVQAASILTETAALPAAGTAARFVFSMAIVCAAVGMLRARILPAPAVVLGMFPVMPTNPVDALPLSPSFLEAFLAASWIAGLAWIGWAMWREPALDEMPSDSVTAQ